MELCEICRINTATIHMTQISNGETLTRHLCADCAEDEGLPIHGQDENGEMMPGTSAEEEPLTCPRCGTTEDQLAATGETGCVHCYEIFRDFIAERSGYMSAFRRYDGKKYRQSGSRSFQSELDTLRRELGSAISEQRFEAAAVIRDRILELEAHEAEAWN